MSPTTVFVTTPRCTVCHHSSTVVVDAAAHAWWKAGALVQNAFPDLPADEREQLKSGIHPECWQTFAPTPSEWP